MTRFTDAEKWEIASETGTIREIVARHGVSNASVTDWRKQFGIGGQKRATKFPIIKDGIETIPPEEWIRRLMLAKGRVEYDASGCASCA